MEPYTYNRIKEKKKEMKREKYVKEKDVKGRNNDIPVGNEFQCRLQDEEDSNRA